MAPAILASLEQEHPPAARYPLQHEYDRAHGPRGYNPYLVIPKNERDRLMMQSVEDCQVNLAKYGQLLEEAALKHQLAHTRSKNVPMVTKPPAEANRSVDLSELQAKLRKLEEAHLGVPDDMSERPPARPGTWTELISKIYKTGRKWTKRVISYTVLVPIECRMLCHQLESIAVRVAHTNLFQDQQPLKLPNKKKILLSFRLVPPLSKGNPIQNCFFTAARPKSQDETDSSSSVTPEWRNSPIARAVTQRNLAGKLVCPFSACGKIYVSDVQLGKHLLRDHHKDLSLNNRKNIWE